jgi:hypothetical protein
MNCSKYYTRELHLTEAQWLEHSYVFGHALKPYDNDDFQVVKYELCTDVISEIGCCSKNCIQEIIDREKEENLTMEKDNNNKMLTTSAINSNSATNSSEENVSDTKSSSSSEELELEDFAGGKPTRRNTRTNSNNNNDGCSWLSVGEFGWKVIFMIFQLVIICLLMSFCMYHLSVDDLSETRELVYWTTLTGCFGILMPTPLTIKLRKKK